jgi:hypothetical protein
MKIELADTIDIIGPSQPDQYGCITVVVRTNIIGDDDFVRTEQELMFAGTSRKGSHALAYALEALAEKLKSSTE